MGMYTELLLRCSLKKEAPDEVVSVCRYLFGNGKQPDDLPTHPFFTLSRWRSVGRCSSYYHFPHAVNLFKFDDIQEGYNLFSRSDLKDYSNEIDAFVSWLMPHIDGHVGEWIGHYFYEEQDLPTPILIKGR